MAVARGFVIYVWRTHHLWGKTHTVQHHYDMANSLLNRQPTACPHGQAMGCLLWGQSRPACGFNVLTLNCGNHLGTIKIYLAFSTISMTTSSNGNIFRITGTLCQEFTGHRWISLTKASDVELLCFLWSVPEWTVEKTIMRLVIWDTIVLTMTSL